MPAFSVSPLSPAAGAPDANGSACTSLKRRVRWIGVICAAALLAMLLPAPALGCFSRAVLVEAASAAEGALAGAAMAVATRSRSALVIYGCLALFLSLLYPLIAQWPPAGMADVRAWRGAPLIVFNYFDVLRPAAFFLALPYPFSALGHHGPDPAGFAGPADTPGVE